MRHRLHGEDGAETVEFAILLPLILLIGLGLYPFLDVVRIHRELGRVADETAIFATQVDANPISNADCGGLTRRRSTAEVTGFAVRSAPALLGVTDVTVGPTAPCLAPPSSPITVTLRIDTDPGPLADTANALSRLLGGRPIIPDPLQVTATSVSHLQ